MPETAPRPPDLTAALASWAETSGCRLLILFGSGATGRGHARSDLDLAAWFEPLPVPERRLRLLGELQDLAGGRPVDLVFLRPETDPVLRFEVFASGVPLYEAGRGLFVSEAVRAVALHEDAIPFRRLLRQKVSDQAEAG